MMMDNNIQMEIGDGSGQETELFGKRRKSADWRKSAAFINQNNTKSKVSFASLSRENYSIDLTQFGGKFICQRFFPLPKVFLLESNSQKLGTGLFGGEGFIMQKIEATEWPLYTPEEH
jgi:hypothetical protein